jgi:hypothetical protein
MANMRSDHWLRFPKGRKSGLKDQTLYYRSSSLGQLLLIDDAVSPSVWLRVKHTEAPFLTAALS